MVDRRHGCVRFRVDAWPRVDGIQTDTAALTFAIVLSGWIPILFVVWRGIRLSVRADQAGVHVRNLFTSFDLRWDEIKSFHIGSDGYFPGMLIITLIDGQTRRAWGVEKPNPAARPNNRSAELIAQALDERLRESSAALRQSSRAGWPSATFR